MVNGNDNKYMQVVWKVPRKDLNANKYQTEKFRCSRWPTGPLVLLCQPSETMMQLSNIVGGLFHRRLAIQQQGVRHSHGTICHAIERQSILVEKLFQLVINLSKINSDRKAHPESDLKKSDLILSSWNPWSPAWLAEKGGAPWQNTMMNCSLTLKEFETENNKLQKS